MGEEGEDPIGEGVSRVQGGSGGIQGPVHQDEGTAISSRLSLITTNCGDGRGIHFPYSAHSPPSHWREWCLTFLLTLAAGIIASSLAMNLEVGPREKISSAISHPDSMLFSPLAKPCATCMYTHTHTHTMITYTHTQTYAMARAHTRTHGKICYLQVCLKVSTQHIKVHLVQVLHIKISHTL